MIDRFLAAREGQKPATITTEKAIANVLRRGFKSGMGVMLTRVKTSDLQAYLSDQANANEWKNRTFNRHRLFLQQMFQLAVADRVLSETTNPFKARLIKNRKKDKVFRHIPTAEQFQAIVSNIRSMAGKQVSGNTHGGIRGGCGKRSIQCANFIEFLGCAGVGQAEASSLCWSDGATP
jgi:integrase